jgi:uncharacterized protein with LGFP repeats
MGAQGARLNTVLRRLGVGLTVLAASVLLAPVAAATPESDANDAITAAFDATGGPTGPLGQREGTVYVIGGGFGQNFASGKMFFTQPTGAHFMQGAVLEKYESQGGPADGDLGFPTLDEGPGRVGPDSRNVTFSAGDKPVIFWTPATGARVVRGAINAAWDKLGGSAGALGVPTEDEVYKGDLISQKFTGGELSWNRKTKSFTTTPPELADQLGGLEVPDDPTSAINAARRAAGGALGPLGAREGEQFKIGADGIGQKFAGGTIYYSPATGANVLTGQVLEKYDSVGGPQSDLGLPTSSETGSGATSRAASFAAGDKPVIFWTPDFGAVIVRGAMNAAWDKLEGAEGPLGAPMADQTDSGDVTTQRFSGGVISYDSAKNSFTTEPANLASQLAGLEVPAQDVPTTADDPEASGEGGNWITENWNWWWLLALVPILAVVGLIVGAVVLNRRRSRDDSRFDDYDHDDDFGTEQHPVYEPAPAVGDQSRRDDAAARFIDPYEAPPAAEPFGLGGQGAYPPPGRWDPVAGIDRTDDDPDEPTAVVREFKDDHGFEDDHDFKDDHDFDEDDDEVGGTLAHDDDDEFSRLFGGSGNPDFFDTAPTRIETDETPSGRHAAIDLDEPLTVRTAIHLPLDDPDEAPDGYPIKADTRSGLFWSPGSRAYEDAVAEVWFASEEFATTNGFVRAD